MDQLTTENGVENVQLLPAINDHYGGVVVELKEHMDPTIFLTRLKSSMSQWTLQGKRGIWIKLPIRLVNLVETAVKEGFHYHHAEPDYLMLVNWIPQTASTVPANASHRVGVGAIVLNDKREILVVQEKNGILRGTGIWKIPTGIVEEGEDISVGVNREVKEETGIDTEFVEVLAFRQWHKAFFGKSDLFFVCMMRPLSFDIQIQELEIEAAKWMPLEEFAAQPSAQKESLMSSDSDSGEENLEFLSMVVQANEQAEIRPPQTRRYVLRDRIDARDRLMHHYFDENSVYNEQVFNERFRMSKRLFMKIVHDVTAYDDYFAEGMDARGKDSFTAIQKCTSAIRQLAYGETRR